jgi:hypothetical protein
MENAYKSIVPDPGGKKPLGRYSLDGMWLVLIIYTEFAGRNNLKPRTVLFIIISLCVELRKCICRIQIVSATHFIVVLTAT